MPHDKQINKNSVWAAANKEENLTQVTTSHELRICRGVGDSSRGRGQGSACWGVRVERVFYKSINLKRLSNADSKFFTLPNFFLPHTDTDTHTLAQLPPTLRGGVVWH